MNEFGSDPGGGTAVLEDHRIAVSFREYLKLELKEMGEGDNLWFTVEKIHQKTGVWRHPTHEELAENYIGSDAQLDFARRYRRSDLPQD